MNKLVKVEKLTNSKYINLFNAEFETPAGTKLYEIVTRRQQPKIVTKSFDADAIRVIPYYFENGKLKVVLIKEFRYAINQIMWGVPAGLIDKDETPDQALKRELEEEIGASVVNFTQTEITSYSSAGLGDESLICYEAEVKMDKVQHLDKFEQINVVIADFDDLPKLLDTENFGLQSRLQLRCFYYKFLSKVK